MNIFAVGNVIGLRIKFFTYNIEGLGFLASFSLKVITDLNIATSFFTECHIFNNKFSFSGYST